MSVWAKAAANAALTIRPYTMCADTNHAENDFEYRTVEHSDGWVQLEWFFRTPPGSSCKTVSFQRTGTSAGTDASADADAASAEQPHRFWIVAPELSRVSVSTSASADD